MRCRLPIILALGALTLGAGCIPFLTGGPDCTNEVRTVDARSGLDDGSTLTLTVREERNASSKRSAAQQYTWGLLVTRPGEEIVAVHIHDGTLAGGGRELLILDPRHASNSSPLMIVVPMRPYDGAVPFDEVFSALARREVYVDVHAASGPPAAHGSIVVLNSDTGWVHSYCS